MLFDFLKRKQPKLPFVTDIHCHIVPGVDDGSPDIEYSEILLDDMDYMGLKRIFVSPHVTQDKFENTVETLTEPFASLQSAAKEINPAMELHCHAEYRLDQFFMQRLGSEETLPCLPGNYILVENSFGQEPYDLDSVMFDLRMKGYTPILAHPERYKYYNQLNRGRYAELHAAGILFQINLLSLSGHYGKTERATALELLEAGWVQFIGSDIHRQRHTYSIIEYMKSSDFRHDLKLMKNLKNDEI